MFFRVLQKVLYHEKSKMKFAWHRGNGKLDRILRSRFESSLVTSLIESCDWCVIYEPETKFCANQHQLKMTSSTK